MPSLKEIRARIDSTKSTQQITKAMKLVSTAKLRKAQHQIVNMRPYANTLLGVIGDIALTQKVDHPLLKPHDEVKKILLVVVTSDRGLCGAFNGQINKFAESYVKENEKAKSIDLMFIGKRGADFFARRGKKSVETITRLDKDVSYELASRVAEKAMNTFLSGEYDEVRFVYNEFKSAISQNVVSEPILPVNLKNQSLSTESKHATFSVDMIFEPKPDQIIEQLLIKHFSIQVYRCLCESVAAEHGARMSAMENATNNAKEVVSRLTLTYNKLRQEKITTELIEIVSGAEALK